MAYSGVVYSLGGGGVGKLEDFEKEISYSTRKQGKKIMLDKLLTWTAFRPDENMPVYQEENNFNLH